MEQNMKTPNHKQFEKTELTRLDRIALHLRCLCRDHKCRWHLAGIWREVTLQ
jgi:hypothetical protein